ncbi:MAG: response regulator, partial [Spirochaetales bacterium]
GQLKSRLKPGTDGIERCFTTVIDVADRKRIEDDLILAREDAIQASRAKSLFLANMSHEIRTPLNGILAMSEFTLQAELSEEQREWVQIIPDSSKSLTAIIDDVLDFSRMEADAVKLDPAPFDLGDLIRTITALFKPQAREKGLSFVVEMAPEADRWYRGDVYRIRQILNTLLSNAVKFPDSGDVAVSIRRQPISEYIQEIAVTVHDTGIGIPASKKDMVFDSFTQGDISYSKSYQGTGLGLAISRRLARLMSGQLYFTSVEGQGSSFFFTAPLHLHDSEDDGQSDRVGRSTAPAILVAEDNVINTMVLKTMLEKAGYRVQTVSSGTGAIAAVESATWDLVLMDISMPDMDGVEATRIIRAAERGKAIVGVPIVAITAHSMKGDRERFLNAGMNAYIAKPFTRDLVLTTVEAILGRARHS